MRVEKSTMIKSNLIKCLWRQNIRVLISITNSAAAMTQIHPSSQILDISQTSDYIVKSKRLLLGKSTRHPMPKAAAVSYDFHQSSLISLQSCGNFFIQHQREKRFEIISHKTIAALLWTFCMQRKKLTNKTSRFVILSHIRWILISFFMNENDQSVGKLWRSD